MPYPTEHAARLADPKQFDRIRRENDAFGDGIHAIYGIKGGKSTLQAIRFDKARFSSDEARAWLKKHNHDPIEFEPAKKMADDATVIGFGDGDGALFIAEDGSSDWVHVFTAGKYPQGEIDKDGVEEMAATYDEGLHSAPVSIDHKDEGPSFGWVAQTKALLGRLYVRFRDIVPQFRELAPSALPRRSIEAYPPKHPANPTPGRWYLKAVSFLGVKAPAVKGLEPLPASFSQDSQSLSFAFEERTEMPDKPKSDQDDPQAQIAKLQEELEGKDAEIQKLAEQAKGDGDRDAEVKKLTEANAELATRIAKMQAEQARRDAQAFVEKRLGDGALVPSLTEGLDQFLVLLDELPSEGDGAKVVTFAETDKDGQAKEVTLSARAWFERFLDQLPKVVSFEEAARDDGEPGASSGFGAGAWDRELDAKARAYMEAHKDEKISYADALVAVAG